MGAIRFFMFVMLFWMALRWVRSVTRPVVSAPARGRVPPRRSAYDVLGVPPGSSIEQIRAAYQTMVQQYHPDKVQGMGPELREVAERRTKEINAAYNELKRAS